MGGSPQGRTHCGDHFHVIFLFVSLPLEAQVFLFNFFFKYSTWPIFLLLEIHGEVRKGTEKLGVGMALTLALC